MTAGAILGFIIAACVKFGDDARPDIRSERFVGLYGATSAGDGAVRGVRVGPHERTVHHDFAAAQTTPADPFELCSGCTPDTCGCV